MSVSMNTRTNRTHAAQGISRTENQKWLKPKPSEANHQRSPRSAELTGLLFLVVVHKPSLMKLLFTVLANFKLLVVTEVM